ncbi:hypothetical protein ACRRTK_002360 [Alexandromys fortis]
MGPSKETRQMEGLEFVAQVNDTRPRALAVAVNEALKEEEEVPSARSAVAEKQLLVMMCQGPSASNQASVSATLEWQEMLEAAEALMTLKNSSQTRHQPCGVPGPAGERGLQLASPTMPPLPASSGSLTSGHLDCMSLLT